MLAVATPFFMSRLLDHVASGSVRANAIYSFVGYSALFGVTLTFNRAQTWLAQGFENSVNFLTSTMLMKRVMRKTPEFFVETGSTEIQAAIQQAQTGARSLFNLSTLVVLPGLVQFAAAVVLLGTALRAEVAIVVFFYGSFFIGLTYYLTWKARPHLERANESFRQNARQVGHIISLMETLRYFNAQHWFIGKYNERAHDTKQAWAAWAGLHARASIIFGLAVFLQFAVNYFLIVPDFASGKLSIGGLILFNALLIQLNTPFELLGNSIGRSSQALTMLTLGAKIADYPEEEDSVRRNPSAEPNCNANRLLFRNVAYSYVTENRTSEVLKDVSFEVERKRLNFITGPSGAGKSTVLKLMLKNLRPNGGQILIGDADLAGIEREDWYSAVGVVPQEIVLVGDTIEDNILLGRTASKAEVESALERSAIASLIKKLPLGLKTVVGERGLRLSGGERQRIGIARALLKNPAVLLLDEASSALDEFTERSIMDELRKLRDQVIIVAVTHRESILKPGDQAIRLKAGIAVSETV
jgi:ABC-type bacteriocin/lantibiotic exporter with double-glycine peptidase domain